MTDGEMIRKSIPEHDEMRRLIGRLRMMEPAYVRYAKAAGKRRATRIARIAAEPGRSLKASAVDDGVIASAPILIDLQSRTCNVLRSLLKFPRTTLFKVIEHM